MYVLWPTCLFMEYPSNPVSSAYLETDHVSMGQLCQFLGIKCLTDTIDFTLRYVVASIELKLFFLFWITKKKKLCIMNAGVNHMSMGIPVLHWSRGIVSLARYDVTGCTGGCHFDNFWCSRCRRFRRRFYSCVLRFWDNSVDSRYVAVIQRYDSDEHNNYYGKNLVRLTPTNDDPYFVLTGEIWDFYDWKLIAIYRGWNG